MLSDERLDDLDDLLLLAAGKTGDSVEHLAGLAGWRGGTAGHRFAEQVLDSHAERLSHWHQDVRFWGAPGPFPITDVRRVFPDLARKFAECQSGRFAQ